MPGRGAPHDGRFRIAGPGNVPGGIDGYRRFYGGMSDVQVQNARSTGENQVSATIVFTRTDGSTSTEPYTFTVGTDDDGDSIIQSFSRG